MSDRTRVLLTGVTMALGLLLGACQSDGVTGPSGAFVDDGTRELTVVSPGDPVAPERPGSDEGEARRGGGAAGPDDLILR